MMDAEHMGEGIDGKKSFRGGTGAHSALSLVLDLVVKRRVIRCSEQKSSIVQRSEEKSSVV